MRAAVFAIPMVTLAAFAAQAQERTVLPEIVIGGGAPNTDDKHSSNASASSNGQKRGKVERCVDVTIGHEDSLGCMNEELRQQVDKVNPPVLNTPPIDAGSQDLKVGTVNIPAVQQQYGKNFGVSAVPFRPPPPVFAAPVGAPHH
jgi:hypothetical protein